jgi:hypothetical protein
MKSGFQIISLCSMNGVELEPWAEAGYHCAAVDIQNEGNVKTFPSGGSIEFVSESVYDLSDNFCEGADLTFAFPPCTDLAVSGARWFKSKEEKNPGTLERAMALVHRCWDLASKSEAWALENPVSRIATQWRKSDHRFDPCEYGGYIQGGGDAYTKKTCLWVGGQFTMPSKKPVEATEGSKMHTQYGGKSLRTKNARSKTPEGWSLACFQHFSPMFPRNLMMGRPVPGICNPPEDTPLGVIMSGLLTNPAYGGSGETPFRDERMIAYKTVIKKDE